MESCHFGASPYSLRMLYDIPYQDNICKYCHQCNQDRFGTNLHSSRPVYNYGINLSNRAQSPTFLPLTERRVLKETFEIVERKGMPRERLKFSVEAILGSSCTEEKKTTDGEGTSNFEDGDKTSKEVERSAPLTTKRAVFSDYQRRQLEQEFLAHKYINKQERKQLSARLCLTESQIRIWFQNRRMKWRNWQEREIMRRKRHAGLEQI